MTSEDTLLATTRLTLGLSRLSAPSQPPPSQQPSAVHTDDILDRRKRKREDHAQDTGHDVILTPGNTPLPRPLGVDPPLLAHRYQPISIAGDGAFSRTIFARDTFAPNTPLVAIKAMKPGFEVIGRQEYKLLRRIQNLPMPKHTRLPIVTAIASFSALSTYHLVLEALEAGQLRLPHCPHSPRCTTAASCPIRQAALRKVAVQLLLGLSVLHDQMGYIHADLKPENILRCRGGTTSSMKLKLIDLGNALPVERANIYYDDFEVQSIHYRAPEVLLGLPFTSAIDIFSLGLILAELLLAQPDMPLPPSTTRHRQPTFPTSPPQSHSPQPLHNLPLLSTVTSNRRSFVNQMVRLFGPLPQIYRTGKFWSDEYIPAPFTHNGTLLAQRLDNEGVDSELSDFIMGMLSLDPEKRISARDALRHEWLVGPLLGYWAVLGVEWKSTDSRESGWQRPADTAKREIIEPRTSTPEISESPIVEKRRLPPIHNFSTKEEEEEDNEEVSFVYAGSSPTRPLPFNGPQIPSELEEQVLDLRDGANARMMMTKYYYCKYVELL